MKLIDQFLRLLEIIAWPGTVLALALVFRAELRMVMGRLSLFEYKGLKAHFYKGLQAIDSRLSVAKIQDEALSDEALSERERLYRLAKASPRAAIAEAWILVERVLPPIHASHEQGRYRAASLPF